MDKSAQEPIRFQYSLIVNISLMDWHLNLVHINRHERKQQVLLMDFLKKILFQGKQAILGLKMMHSHNFGLMQRVFLTFCIMKEVERQVKIILRWLTWLI